MKLICKPKRKFSPKNLETYDCSFVYTHFLLLFAFAVIFAIFSSSLLIIYPHSNDKPEDNLLNDIFEKISDIVTGLIQSSPKNVHDEGAGEEKGIQTILTDPENNLQVTQAVDANGNLIYRVIHNLN